MIFSNFFNKKDKKEKDSEKPTQVNDKMLKLPDLMDLQRLAELKFEASRLQFEAQMQRTINDDVIINSNASDGMAMDSAFDSPFETIAPFANTVSSANLNWYASQGFIGHQLCALLAQGSWLINKACTMPAKDAVRKGYELTVNDGTEVPPEVLEEIKQLDIKYGLKKNCVEFVKMGRIFGIRIAMFEVISGDPDYYKKPFNIDGVKAGSYKGIVQVDPFWITPIFDAASSSDPSSLYFYEPTWWQLNGKMIHRTHLVIMRTSEVADVYKPTYLYGGIPIPQQIYERVAAAERTANEAPHLAMTKRTFVLKTDLAATQTHSTKFTERLERAAYYRDNYATQVIDHEDEVIQLETSLADFDAVMMSQYQIVAAAACVPAVKLLGTTPKGFNATGEYEEASYHEELESIQEHDLTPLIHRHHELLVQSEICPRFGMESFQTQVSWHSLDSFTAKEKAELNKMKAETAVLLVQNGIISPADELRRIINDKESGYNGLNIDPDELENEEEPEDLTSELFESEEV